MSNVRTVQWLEGGFTMAQPDNLGGGQICVPLPPRSEPARRAHLIAGLLPASRAWLAGLEVETVLTMVRAAARATGEVVEPEPGYATPNPDRVPMAHLVGAAVREGRAETWESFLLECRDRGRLSDGLERVMLEVAPVVWAGVPKVE